MPSAGGYLWLTGPVGFGLLAWLALPGSFQIWPLLFICLLPLLFSTENAATAKTAFIRGISAGIIFYVLQLYWIVSVLKTYGGLHPFIAASALLLLVVYMSFYLGFFSAAVYCLSKPKSLLVTILGLPSIWVGLDWIRSWIFGGFPWMDFGYGLWSYPELLQVADIFGHHLLTFMIILINTSFFIILKGDFRRVQKGVALGIMVLTCGAVLLYSQQQWHQVSAQLEGGDHVRIGIVQGNIEQGRKWSPEARERTVATYLDLSKSLATNHSPDLIVWPETALPFFPQGNKLLKPVHEFVRNYEQVLLTGAPWYEIKDWEKRLLDYYNAAFLLPEPEETMGHYFKSHLVPYGEYVPLKKYIPFLAPLVEAAGDFSRGTIGEPLKVGSIMAGVLICYESIFPSISRTWVENGANVIVNLTNDAWYGKSSAPYQSWAMTVLRAVETRRSLVRSANTGI